MQNLTRRAVKQQVIYIPVRDLARAQRFYAAVFGLELDTFTTSVYTSGERFSMLPLPKPREGEGRVSTGFLFVGLGESPDLVPSKEGVMVYLPCDDIDETLARVEANGGQVLKPKTRDLIPEAPPGQHVDLYHAFFCDSEGNKVGLTYCLLTMPPTPNPSTLS